jgi:Carboxypeptidase regulatory-like domain/TonB-dependent Receptor Plug Domain
MRNKVLSACCLSTLVWSITAVPLTAAQGVGAIGGTISDVSGAALPGATVTLSNPGTIGGNQVTVADEHGAFQFIRLVPAATYAVKAERAGFRPAVQENVVVDADVTTRVDLKLEVGSLQESFTVKGEVSFLDTTSALKQTVLSREDLNALPNRMDVWSIARVVPSVILSKVDVGGSEAFLQSLPTVHGTSQENGYFIDGMDVSVLGNGTLPAMYLNPYIFEQTNIQTGVGSAERQKGGLIFTGRARTSSVAARCSAAPATAWDSRTTRRRSRRSSWRPFPPRRSLPIPISSPAATF